LHDFSGVALRGCLDRFDGADLVGPHDLALVKQEHRHPCYLHQLINLAELSTVRLLGKPAGRAFSDPVSLVADEGVEIVRFGLAELVEIAE
jgi:hypothetical protein